MTLSSWNCFEEDGRVTQSGYQLTSICFHPSKAYFILLLSKKIKGTLYTCETRNYIQLYSTLHSKPPTFSTSIPFKGPSPASFVMHDGTERMAVFPQNAGDLFFLNIHASFMPRIIRQQLSCVDDSKIFFLRQIRPRNPLNVHPAK